MSRNLFVPVNAPVEGEEFSGPIVVGTGLTEHCGSDCYPYEVIAVRDQKHITVRSLDHERAKCASDYSNDWDLFSDTDRASREMIKYGDIWFWKFGNRRSKANVWFGRAEYYYDYEF